MKTKCNAGDDVLIKAKVIEIKINESDEIYTVKVESWNDVKFKVSPELIVVSEVTDD